MLNIGEIIASKKPYVYALTYPNGLIFYIGKGKRVPKLKTSLLSPTSPPVNAIRKRLIPTALLCCVAMAHHCASNVTRSSSPRALPTADLLQMVSWHDEDATHH